MATKSGGMKLSKPMKQRFSELTEAHQYIEKALGDVSFSYRLTPLQVLRMLLNLAVKYQKLENKRQFDLIRKV